MLFVSSVGDAVSGWRTNPFRMVAKLIASTVVGQMIFWKIGYDQLGVAMEPKRQFGAGIRLANGLASRLPVTPRVAWTIKVIEIATDAAKMPIEGAAYRRYGIAPDVVACAVTQPLWSGIETVEKTVGVIMHPERVTSPAQIRLSIACIYGSLVRYVLGCGVIVAGRHIDRLITDPVERTLRFIFKKR